MSGKSLYSLVRQVHPQRDVSACQRPQLFEGYQGRKHLHKTNSLHFPQRAALLFQGDLRALHTVLDKPLPRLPHTACTVNSAAFISRLAQSTNLQQYALIRRPAKELVCRRNFQGCERGSFLVSQSHTTCTLPRLLLITTSFPPITHYQRANCMI
jgi:hypothetical protein